jgi:hypothetical protein
MPQSTTTCCMTLDASSTSILLQVLPDKASLRSFVYLTAAATDINVT